MDARETLISRIREVGQLIDAIDADRLKLDRWVSETDDQGCRTICCAAGWMATKQMYGLTFGYGHAQPLHAIPTFFRSASEFNVGYSAIAAALTSGLNLDEQATADIEDLAAELFCPVGESIFDDGVEYEDDHKQIFLNRIPNVVSRLQCMVLTDSTSEE